MARENPDLIIADMVDAQRFYTLSRRFGVASVPLTVINGQESFVGALPETAVVGYVKKAMGGSS